MKNSRSRVRMKATAIPMLRFEDQRLTSFAGVVVLQRFFQLIALKTRLRQCFRHVAKGKIYDPTAIFLQLIVHLVLGFRELRDVAHYRDDPLVQRLLGLRHLPNVATISRMLKAPTSVLSTSFANCCGSWFWNESPNVVCRGSRLTSTVRCSRPNATRKARPSDSTRRRRGPAVTIPCSACWLRRAKCWTFCIERAMCMIRTARIHPAMRVVRANGLAGRDH